jgi:hypothetical protein
VKEKSCANKDARLWNGDFHAEEVARRMKDEAQKAIDGYYQDGSEYRQVRLKSNIIDG